MIKTETEVVDNVSFKNFSRTVQKRLFFALVEGRKELIHTEILNLIEQSSTLTDFTEKYD